MRGCCYECPGNEIESLAEELRRPLRGAGADGGGVAASLTTPRAARTCPRPRKNHARSHHTSRKLASLFGKSDANLHAEHSLPADDVGIGARRTPFGNAVRCYNAERTQCDMLRCSMSWIERMCSQRRLSCMSTALFSVNSTWNPARESQWEPYSQSPIIINH